RGFRAGLRDGSACIEVVHPAGFPGVLRVAPGALDAVESPLFTCFATHRNQTGIHDRQGARSIAA
ncbi:MAG: hypothetical protein VB131_08065, partial [Burkholderia gladioli]